MKQKTAIIIGAGIGGLATAIQLAQYGFKVTIFEKNDHPGGRCQQIMKDGHVFDTGPTMYLFPQIYKSFFSLINEDLNKHIKLIRTNPTYQLNFADNTHITLTSNFEKMRTQLEKLESGSYQRFLDYLESAKKHHDVAMNNITTKSLIHPLEYFNLKNLYLLFKTNAATNHYSYTNKFFRHPHLGAAFTFQDSYLSLNPFQAPAIYSMFTYTELVDGNYLPKGGMYQIILALEKIAKKHQVKIVYQSSVKKINARNHQAESVTLENDTVETADYIIVNADLSYAYKHLLPQNSYQQSLLKQKYSCSAVLFHWGLSKTYPQLKTHNLFFSDSYREGFEQVINRAEPPSNPHFYIQAPSRTDPSRAPKNHDTLSVIVPINHINPSQVIDWKKYQNNVRKYIINRLEKAGLNDIENHIKFEASYTPLDWQNHLNLTYGSIYGLHHNLSQLGYLRPNRKHRQYKNLFFVGASTHPGSGLPTVLLSSQFTSKAIQQAANQLSK